MFLLVEVYQIFLLSVVAFFDLSQAETLLLMGIYHTFLCRALTS